MVDENVCANVESLNVKTELPLSTCVTNKGTHEVVSPAFSTRFIYNSHVNPATVEAAFARKKSKLTQKSSGIVPSRIFWAGPSTVDNHVNDRNTVNVSNTCSQVQEKCSIQSMGRSGPKSLREYTGDSGSVVCGVERHLHGNTHDSLRDTSTNMDTLSDTYKHALSDTYKRGQGGVHNTQDEVRTNVNAANDGHSTIHCIKPLYDVNYCGFDDKFTSEIICATVRHRKARGEIQTPIFDLWRDQVDFTFGFVPLEDQVMPTSNIPDSVFSGSLLQAHELVKATGKPNDLQARIPIQSQLNVEQWEKALVGYWDRQLLDLLKYGFPVDFNRSCDLGQYTGNHSSANDFPKDIEPYLQEELSYGALLGPFKTHPIEGGHCSPFMTRSKPKSDRCRVIVDLSWHHGASVNAGIDKASYLDSAFELTFPTVDDITSELKRLGCGALIYKVDV